MAPRVVVFPVILLDGFDPPRLRVPAAVFFVALPVARFVVLARFVPMLRVVVPVARLVVVLARFAAPVFRVVPLRVRAVVARFAGVLRAPVARFGVDEDAFGVRDRVLVARFGVVLLAAARRVRAIPILLRWGRGQDTFPIRTILHTPLSEPLR